MHHDHLILEWDLPWNVKQMSLQKSIRVVQKQDVGQKHKVISIDGEKAFAKNFFSGFKKPQARYTREFTSSDKGYMQ